MAHNPCTVTIHEAPSDPHLQVKVEPGGPNGSTMIIGGTGTRVVISKPAASPPVVSSTPALPRSTPADEQPADVSARVSSSAVGAPKIGTHQPQRLASGTGATVEILGPAVFDAAAVAKPGQVETIPGIERTTVAHTGPESSSSSSSSSSKPGKGKGPR